MTSPPDTPASPASFDHDALPPGTRFGEFEILRVIGIGGFGIVYLARDHSLERDVALKEYMPATLAMRGNGPQITVRSSAQAETYAIGLRSFINEARLLARFDHPSLVKVYRFWEDNRTAYMVMPFLQGVTLRDTRRAMAHPPDEAWIRRVIDPVMSALELLHREGVYHRDIAPDNILLPPEGPPVLLDFGAARRVISDRTQSLTAILKPSYAPIEQYAEMTQLRQGPWTDIYALGAVVHYLLFGKPPQPATARALEPDVDTIAGRTVEGVSSRFLEAIDWALAVRPARRPQSIADFRGALDGVVAIPVRDAQPLTLPGALAPPPPAAPSADADAPTRHVDTSSHATVQWTAPPVTSQPAPGPAATTTSSAMVAPTAPVPADAAAWASTAYSPRTSADVPTGPHTTAPSWPPHSTVSRAPLSAPTPEARKAAAAAIRSTIFPRPPASPPPAPRWKNVLAYSVIGALFVLVIVLAAWLVLEDRRPERRTAGAAQPAPGASAALSATPKASQPPVDITAQAPAATTAAVAAPAASSPASTVAAGPLDAVDSASSAGARAPSGPAVATGSAASAVAPPQAASSSASSAATRVAAAASGASAPVRVRPPAGGARADGALRPLPGTEHPYDATTPVAGGATGEARSRPPAPPTAQATPQGPASAGDACSGLGFIARAVCMDRECDSARFRDTAECLPVLARKRLREGR